MENIAWNIIDKYFKDNPFNLVAHHLDSFNHFIEVSIPQIFKENNPVKYLEKEDKLDANTIPKQCSLYLGGKDAKLIYFGKPIIYDETINGEPNPHYMFPNDARLRNMTYGFTIHYDIEAEFIYMGENGEEIKKSSIVKNIYLGRFPIMLQSNTCILKGLTREVKYNMGECRNDIGGYFIIDGKEKVIISQEKFADNMLYVKKHKSDDIFNFSAEIRSVSEDVSKPIRYTSVRMVAPDSKFTNHQIVIDIPNVRKPIPLFILMRALGVISDKSIIEYCLLNLKNNDIYIDFFIPSIHDAHQIFNQLNALEFIASFTKRQTTSSAWDILTNYFLPHIGTNNYLDKAYFIGYMVFKVLKVFNNQDLPTDRDSFQCKRVETSGNLLANLFREYFILQNKQIALHVDKEFYFHLVKYENNPEAFTSIFNDKSNLKKIFFDMIVETGFKKAFKGNWGASANTKKIGILQDLNRLSYFTYISHVRKLNLPMDSSSKAVGPHLLHNSQWGIIDPVDTPDGGNVGLHKHLAIATKCSIDMSIIGIKNWLRKHAKMMLLQENLPKQLSFLTKIFINGNWAGVLDQPIETIQLFKLYRYNGLIPIYTSICFLYSENEIHIYCDAGRLMRPVFYKDYKNHISFDRKHILENIEKNNYSWDEVITGFGKKTFIPENNKVYAYGEMYKNVNDETLIDFLSENSSLIQYIDTSEEECALIANNMEEWAKNKRYTNLEIHGSLILGVMGNSVIFPENNQLPRDVFSCGQSRQAVSVYHSNYQMRIDKTGVVLNYGQVPLVKSRYLEYINKEEQPYGVNTIVAIMSYSGYNVEDAILINEGSIKRGLFNTTYYSSYESRESSDKISGTTSNSTFSNIEKLKNIKNLKPGHDYSYLDQHGLVKENTPLNDKIIILGQVESTTDSPNTYLDSSVKTKKGQLGFVDKTFITEGEEGHRIGKVRIREERVPSIGDKMASRAGQKGTIGLIIPEADMPFTEDGLRPDLIINPHALPSRMTIGQLVESVLGKLGLQLGYFGDCTAFQTKGSNLKIYGDMLVKNGFASSGDQLMYSGYTGEQLSGNIFIGPTYYMRLKHMVKDKINYRARGPRNILTRQTVQGRANDGGLRIGEMERDGILAHGASYFLNESYMERGDVYFMAICNKSGAIAVYNKALNIFYSPFVDGPIHFNKDTSGNPILDVFSIYGRSFSIVKIPYALKLLIQELQVMNIQMRIITEKNIDQLLNMSYQSKNLEILLEQNGSEKVRKQLKRVQTNTDPVLDSSELNVLALKYRDDMKNKANEIAVETYIPDVLEADLPSIQLGSEVILLDDPIPNRKWIVKKMIGADVFIQTSKDLLSLPKNTQLDKSGTSALKLVNVSRVVLFSEDIKSFEDIKSLEDIPPPDSRVNTPDTFATDSTPIFRAYSSDSPISSVGSIYDPNAPTDSAENAAFYEQQKLRLQAAKAETMRNASQTQGQTPGESPVSSVGSIYDPNAPTDSAENAAFYEQQKLRLRIQKQEKKDTQQNQGTALDFENTNYVSIKPNTKSDDDKLGILTMDKEESKVEEKTEKDDSSVKKIISLTGL